MVTVSITKPAGPVGISFQSGTGAAGGPTTISGFSEKSKVKDTALEAGMVLVSVNGTPVKNAEHAKELISKIGPGEDLILEGADPKAAAEPAAAPPATAAPALGPGEVLVTITKPAGPVGVSLQSSQQAGGPTTITGFSATSPLKDSALKAGFAIVSVNGTKVDTADHARQLIGGTAAGTDLVLVGKDMAPPAAAPAPAPEPVAAPAPALLPGQVLVTITKPAGPVGVSLQSSQTAGGATTITGFSATSPLKDSELKSGFTLVSVNGTKVDTADHARQLIGGTAAGAELALIGADPSFGKEPEPAAAPPAAAAAPALGPGEIMVTVTKPDGPVGVSLQSSQTAGGATKVTGFSATSPLKDTELKAGFTLVSIGGVAVSTAEHARQLIGNTPAGTDLVIIAKPPAAAPAPAAGVAAPIIVKIIKPDGPVGVSLQSSKSGSGKTTVTGFSPTSPLKSTELKAGLILVSVNDVPVTNAEHARQLISQTAAGTTLTLAAAPAPGKPGTGGKPIQVPKMSQDSLAAPYPVPELITIEVTKPDGPVGLSMKSPMKTGPVTVTGFSETSALKDSDLKVGMSVLAVNDVPVTMAEHTNGLIKATEAGTTLKILASAASQPFCKVVVAPTSKTHPGVKFTSTRGNCLVQVSRVFAQGPFASTDLKRDDIVLAVNGVAVSEHQNAMSALQLSIDEPFTTIYAADMSLIRKSLLDNLKQPGFEMRQESYNSYDFYANGNWQFGVEYNLETQRLRAHQFSASQFHTLEKTVIPFLKEFNTSMDKAMTALEEAVACEAWKQEVAKVSAAPADPMPEPEEAPEETAAAPAAPEAEGEEKTAE